MIRHYIVRILLLIIPLNVWGQKMPEDYMNEARAEKFHKKDAAALANFTYVTEYYPKSKFCEEAYYNMGAIYLSRGDMGMAISAFRASVSCHVLMLPNTQRFYFGLPGKNAACELSDIYERKGNYDSALYFHALNDTGYMKLGGCAYAVGADQERTIIRYADICLKANRIADAEKELLSRHVFGWVKSDNYVSAKLKVLFKKYENTAELKKEMELAVNNNFFDTVYLQPNHRVYPMIYCCFNFRGAKVRLSYKGIREVYSYRDELFRNSSENIELPKKEEIITQLKKSELYTLVEELK